MRYKRLLGRLKRPIEAPPQGGNLATENITQAGWLTYGIALPEGAADDLEIGSAVTQVDVKCAWGDGSIKHAIVTAPVAGTGTVLVNAGTSDAGSFSPTWPACTVTLVQSNSPGGGASAAGTYVATLGSYSGADPWLSGVNVNAASVWKTPVLGGVTDHTNIRVRFDVYSYNDNTHVIDIAVENTLNNSTNREFIYAIDIAVGGVSQHSEAAIYHLPFQVKTRQVTSGSPTLAQVERDMTPFYRAAAVPQYLSDAIDLQTGSGLSSLTAHGYNSMDGLGPFLLPMDAHGGRPEIGLHTGWVVSWIVHQRQEQYEYIQKLVEYAGNYNVHMRKSDNSDIYRTVNNDSTCLHPSSGSTASGLNSWQPTAQSVTITSNGTTATATISSGVPGFFSVGQTVRFAGVTDGAWNADFAVSTIPSSTTMTFAAPNGNTSLTGSITCNILPPSGEINHLPNMAFTQYLVSGRRRAMDEMIYYANFCLLNTAPEQRGRGYGYSPGAVASSSNAAKGYINSEGIASYPELRGSAWGIRDLAQCGKWLPDGMSLKTYFATIAQNNIDDTDAYCTQLQTAPSTYYTNVNTALDAPFPMKRPEDAFGATGYPGKTWLSSFEQSFVATVFHFVVRNQGWTGGTVTLNMVSQFWSRLADTNQIPSGFDITYLSPYVIAAGTRNVPGVGSTLMTFYTTLEDVYDHTYTAGAGGVDGVHASSTESWALYVRTILMIAAYDSYAGASAGVTYLDRVGGLWDNTYRTNGEYTPSAFATVEVMP